MTQNAQQYAPARAHRAAALSLTAATDTKIPLDTVDFDLAGGRDATHFYGGTSAHLVTNGNKYVCPVAGFYLVLAQVRVAATASGQTVRAIIRQAGVNTAAGSLVHSSAAGDLASSASDILNCAAGDAIELYANSTDALALSALAANNNYMTVRQFA